MKSQNLSTKPIAATLAFYYAFILLGLTTAVTGPTLPELANRTSSRIDQISFIFITGSLGYMTGSWIGGRAYDRLPGNRILPFALVLLALAAAYIPTASQLSFLTLGFLVLGFAQGVVDVGGNTLLIWHHGAGVSPFMNGLHFFFGVGALLSPIIVAQIVNSTGNIELVYWLFGLMALPLAAWTWFLKNPSRHEKDAARKEAHYNYLIVILVVLFFFLYVGAEIGYGNWIFTYATALELGTPMSAAYLTSAFWGFFTIGRLIGIPVAVRAAPTKILFIDLIGCLFALGLIIIGSQSQAALWTGTILLGLCMASVFPTIMTLADSKLHLSGEITGWFLIGAGLGGMFLPWLIGQAFASIGPTIMPTLIFMDILANLVILAVLAGRFIHLKSTTTQETQKNNP
jgi:FHS family Na+ dependent glucose MFS transporter 1